MKGAEPMSTERLFWVGSSKLGFVMSSADSLPNFPNSSIVVVTFKIVAMISPGVSVYFNID